MTEFRAGQRVRIEYPHENGSPAVEGVLVRYDEDLAVDLPDQYLRLGDLPKSCVVTVLAEPKVEEPTGLGAVVEAAAGVFTFGRQWVHVGKGDWLCVMDDAREPNGFWTLRERWADLVDPVVLSEGWKP